MTAIPVIETRHLTKRFGKRTVVNELNLSVPQGSVFAFLGRNGAGKTTTIRMLLDLLDRTSGEARILGLDCRKDAVAIKRRIGAVVDGQTMYDWMTVDEIIWFCRGFYPGWDDKLTANLKAKLELPGKQKVGQLSRGGQAKLALLLATAYHPELLILDEPTTGLDVVTRRDFLEGIIELLQDDGHTVFFSSHIVHEVERVADWVAIIDHGALIACAPLDTLKAKVKRLVITFDDAVPTTLDVPNTLQIQQYAREAAVTVSDFSEDTLAMVKTLHPTAIQIEDLTLEDIFVAYVGAHTETDEPISLPRKSRLCAGKGV